MIQKENFCRLINTLHAYDDELEEVRGVMPGLTNDIVDITGNVAAEIVVFLDAEMGLPTIDGIGSTISWWIWDTHYGKDHPDITIKSRDGKKSKVFHLNTVEKLYDYIVKYEANYETNAPKRRKSK